MQVILFNGGDTNLYGYVMNDPVNGIDPSGLRVFYVGIGLGASLAGSPGSGSGQSVNASWGIGLDTSDWTPFKYNSQVTGTDYTFGGFAGGGFSVGYYPGNRSQFSGAGSSSNTCAGIGFEGGGFGITESSGLKGVQFDIFGPGFGLNANRVQTFTNVSPLWH